MRPFIGPFAAVCGFAVWTVLSVRPGGEIREAWDGTPYWTIGLPLLLLLHAGLGAGSRGGIWRLPAWTVAGHFLAVILVSRGGTGLGLLPLALLFVGVPLYVALALAGWCGRGVAALLR